MSRPAKGSRAGARARCLGLAQEAGRRAARDRVDVRVVLGRGHGRAAGAGHVPAVPADAGLGDECMAALLLALLREAQLRGAELVVFPELALTTFFPRWYLESQAEIDAYFETEM